MANLSRKKMAKGDAVFNVVIYIFLALVVLVTMYPVINLIAYSFSEPYGAVRGHIHVIPRIFVLRNYAQVFKRDGVKIGFLITTARTVIGTAASLFVNALLAFILSRKKFKFKSAFSLFWIITMYVQGGIIPTYLLYRKLGMTQSFLVYIIPGMVNVLYVLVIRTYMKSIPDSLEESAQLEGAGYGRVFFNIISPLCKPVYAAIALFIATYHWNSWFDALLYNRLTWKLTTIQFELFKMNQEARNVPNTSVSSFKSTAATPRTVKAAAIVLGMLPLLIAYPFFQKYFISGLKVGGVKD